jgi:hypothetical protein
LYETIALSTSLETVEMNAEEFIDDQLEVVLFETLKILSKSKTIVELKIFALTISRLSLVQKLVKILSQCNQLRSIEFANLYDEHEDEDLTSDLICQLIDSMPQLNSIEINAEELALDDSMISESARNHQNLHHIRLVSDFEGEIYSPPESVSFRFHQLHYWIHQLLPNCRLLAGSRPSRDGFKIPRELIEMVLLYVPQDLLDREAEMLKTIIRCATDRRTVGQLVDPVMEFKPHLLFGKCRRILNLRD